MKKKTNKTKNLDKKKTNKTKTDKKKSEPKIDLTDVNSIKNSELVSSKKFKEYVFGKQFPLLSLQRIQTHWKKNVNKNKSILIRMYLRIGKYQEFIVTTQKPYFEFNDGLYNLDSDMMIDDISSGMPTLFYHQDCSCPLAIKPNGEKILKQVLEKAGDIYRNINPIVLKNNVISNVIEKLLNASRLEKRFVIIMVMGIINLILTLFILITVGVFLL